MLRHLMIAALVSTVAPSMVAGQQPPNPDRPPRIAELGLSYDF